MKITLSSESSVALQKFENKTGLAPYVIVDKILREWIEEVRKKDKKFLAYLNHNDDKLKDTVVNRAVVLYTANSQFKQRMDGPKCREFLHSFMSHWLAGELVKRYPAIVRQLPDYLKGL